MGLAQWFWRLFFLFAGVIAAHVLAVTLVVQTNVRSEASSASFIWLIGGVTIGVGWIAMWYGLRRIMEPLALLTRHVQMDSLGAEVLPLALDGHDELGALAGAFRQLQRDRARRLDQIQRNNERLQTVLGSMAEGVLAVGADKTILLANEAGRQLLDFAIPDPIGRSLLEVTRARPVYEAVNQSFRDTQPVVTEFDAPGLLRRTLSLRATRLPGTPCPGVMIVLHDMTELRRLENLRRELVANVSHELKTPLAAIKGYAETLRLGAVNDSEHNLHFVRRIEEQADRLHELILDMLQIARIESGQQSFELTEVPVARLVQNCAEQFGEAAAAKQIRLRTEAANSPLCVWADEEGVRTILTNLVDNAIKYTASGGTVTIRAVASAAQTLFAGSGPLSFPGSSLGTQFPEAPASAAPLANPHPHSVILEVADTGIGIAEKDLARIFERFYRVDKARSRELGGTGLGLAIVKHLAQSFGGKVSVESQPHRGSAFRVELPAGPPSHLPWPRLPPDQ